MAKVKLLRKVWNKQAGTILEVDAVQESFLLRKKYAEPIPEKIEPLKPQFAPQNKVEKAPKKNK